MKSLSSILLSFALLSPVPSAFAQPLVAPSTSHDEVTLAELIAQLNALLVRLNAYLQNTTTTPSTTTPPNTSTSTPSVSGNSMSGTLDAYGYGLWNTPAATSSGVDTLRTDFLSRHNEFNVSHPTRTFNLDSDRYDTVTYYNEDGFSGFYRHSNGNSGTITSDVQVSLDLSTYSNDRVSDFTIGINNPIVIEGKNLGSIDGLADYFTSITNSGGFRDSANYNVFDSVFYSKGNIKGAFSDQFTSEGNPQKVAGEVKVWWTDNEWRSNNRDENSLVGVFVADVEE